MAVHRAVRPPGLTCDRPTVLYQPISLQIPPLLYGGMSRTPLLCFKDKKLASANVESDTGIMQSRYEP
jgi:hypothetical protein